MRGNLFPTTVYLDDNTRKHIQRLALTTGKPKAEVVREALTTGLRNYKAPPSPSAQAVLDLIEWAEEQHFTGPKDLSTNHNTYAWDK